MTASLHNMITYAGQLVLLCLASSSSLLAQQSPQLEHRWVYLSSNFQAEAEPERSIAIVRRAKKAGYNGILLTDYKFSVLHKVVDRYFKNVAEFKRVADECEMEIIPAVAPFGYSNGILAHDPNLAEAIPVQELPLTVENGEPQLPKPTELYLANGGFEQATGDVAAMWGFQDEPGKASLIDKQVKHSGNQSLRFENLGKTNAPHGNGRISKKLKLTPWRQYHASVWIRTQDLICDEVRVTAIGNGRTLVHSSLGVKPTQEWTQHHVVFNSLDLTEAQFYCGVWGGKNGTIWFDDVLFEEVAFLNLVRRDDCPLTIMSSDGERFEEGLDFESLVDPNLGNNPWLGEFDVYHQPPKLRLTPNSRIKNGMRLRASYYHTLTIHEGQVACSLDHPDVFRVLKKQVAGVEKLFQPKTYMLSHDEIRIANWGEAGRLGRRTAGQLLAQNVQQTVRVIHEIRPNARFCIWSDMFDPYHNAVKGPYYLVNGPLEGSWEGLPKGTTIINWNSGKPEESLPFFDKLGHTQILAGYYDGDPKSIADWLKKAKGIKSVRGVMYTTWTNNYEHLESFAKSAWQAQP
ncbi:MAG: hypothetical protein U0930_10985 [Pirellulales bacterium]